jgi:hypothetical protein
MANMNPGVIALSVAACVLYVLSMSALGRWLGASREACSVAYIPPAPHGSLGA